MSDEELKRMLALRQDAIHAACAYYLDLAHEVLSVEITKDLIATTVREHNAMLRHPLSNQEVGRLVNELSRRWSVSMSLGKHESRGNIFIRLAANGDKIVGAFCGYPFDRDVVWTGERYETYDPYVHGDQLPRRRVMYNFFVPHEDDMKVIEGGQIWFKDVLAVRGKYGLNEWLFEIERHGDAGDRRTTYSIRPKEKIDDAMRARIAETGLHDLAAI